MREKFQLYCKPIQQANGVYLGKKLEKNFFYLFEELWMNVFGQSNFMPDNNENEKSQNFL
ncbi:hypothetical protein BpHYR1_030506 [Brachionus plicatilis]|uniref:Uncharacterized protein n=1 Tax=Brachionus plicatilis TaxID=10195 RepID=A0A3M7R7Z5_BRAPC|nr:hypothetical protein BpHYR1_030506 [Brachionus plicatilis]